MAKIRVTLNLSQTEIAERLDYVGKLTRGMISNFELSRREPPLPLIVAYAKLANLSTDYLIDDGFELPADRFR